MGRLKIKVFKDYKGKKRYKVLEGMTFRAGGYASRMAAEKQRQRYIKNRKKYGSIFGKK